jgi:glycine cleavage system H protein
MGDGPQRPRYGRYHALCRERLGDIVFVELPEVGAEFAPGDDMAVVESVKAASDVYAPIHGKVIEVNGALSDKPETVNESPTEKGWFCVLEIKDGAEIAGLMDEAAYKGLLRDPFRFHGHLRSTGCDTFP